jgi:hypothetical protein
VGLPVTLKTPHFFPHYERMCSVQILQLAANFIYCVRRMVLLIKARGVLSEIRTEYNVDFCSLREVKLVVHILTI